MSRRILEGSIALFLLSVCGAAAANGRFPSASQLVVDPGASGHAVVRTTFGMLQTTDDGKSWRWICEKALGYDGVYDPAIAVSGDGSIFVGLPDGLSRSTDRACTWTRAGAPISGAYIIDLAVAREAPNRLVAVTALAEGSPPGSHATLFESVDNGKTWNAGVAVSEDLRPLTVELAPSAPKRVYVSGIAPFARFAMVVRSDDSGATWTESTFDVGTASGAYISGVDPTNADRVYLRVDGEVQDELLFSADGGQNFNKIFFGPQLLGFAISPDGKRVAVGGPGVGIHVSGTDHVFTKVSDLSARCLTWTAEGLWVCASDPIDPFAIGRATDPATSVAPLLRLAELEPLACDPKTTSGSICPAYWPEVSRIIKPPGDAGPTADATANDTGSEVDAAGPEPRADTRPGGGGCGCGLGSPSAASALAAAAITFLLYKARRRLRPKIDRRVA